MTPQTVHTVTILGASDNPERYAYIAQTMLQEAGHRVQPVLPTLTEVLGCQVAKNLAECTPADTLTLYVGSARLPALMSEIIAYRPGRVIFNPGTESPPLQAALDAAGIPWLEACTLVLLRTGAF